MRYELQQYHSGVYVSIVQNIKLWKEVSCDWCGEKKAAMISVICYIQPWGQTRRVPLSSFNCAFNNNSTHISLFNLTYFQLNSVLHTQDGTTCYCVYITITTFCFFENGCTANISPVKLVFRLFRETSHYRHQRSTITVLFQGALNDNERLPASSCYSPFLNNIKLASLYCCKIVLKLLFLNCLSIIQLETSFFLIALCFYRSFGMFSQRYMNYIFKSSSCFWL